MTDGPERELERRLAALRDEFDGPFARPAPEPPPPAAELLLVRAGEARVALRLDELLWVEPAPRLARVPGGRDDLAGVAVVRGRVVAALDLAALLDRGRTAAPTHLAVARAEPTLALALAGLEGRTALPRARLPVHEAAGAEVVTTLAADGRPLELVSVAGLLRRIRKGVP